jgi:hypothetical protein
MAEKLKGKSSNQRIQRRTEAAVPVEIRGVDANGEAFADSTEAVEVSRRGLSLLTKRDLPLFTAVTVVLPNRGPKRPGEGPTDFFANAIVVRVVPEGEMNRVGIRFVGATLTTYSAEGGS